MLAGEVVELMTAIHESGSLLYLQDVISVTLSDLGLFLNEVSRHQSTMRRDAIR